MTCFLFMPPLEKQALSRPDTYSRYLQMVGKEPEIPFASGRAVL